MVGSKVVRHMYQDAWISWPLVWGGKPVFGNCLKCPKTSELLSQIEGIHIAGFALMKGGVQLKEHTDPRWTQIQDLHIT
jgi:aspartyl/asparaginyl beta-hydroxylase (cupin superfamily)